VANKEYEDAVALFQLALELPGSGAFRLEGTVKEYRCPSEGEENAALYNTACCYALLGKRVGASLCGMDPVLLGKVCSIRGLAAVGPASMSLGLAGMPPCASTALLNTGVSRRASACMSASAAGCLFIGKCHRGANPLQLNACIAQD
jgi:hypothetical protein